MTNATTAAIMPDDRAAAPAQQGRLVGTLLGVTRISLAWVFLWAFLDKFFGLGYGTCRTDGVIEVGCASAMINGGSPTYGFLAHATDSSQLGFLFQWMASNAPNAITVVDVVFMAALLGIGVAVGLGVGMWIASIGGAVLSMFMYAAGFVWPANNPFMDDHVIYAMLFVLLAAAGAGRHLGIGGWWERTALVQRYRWLK